MNPDSACSPNTNPTAVPSEYPYDTRLSLDYTYSLDKLSCVRQIYFLHLTFAYLVVLSGIACFAARAIPSLFPYHALFGRTYILCMLWCMATSLLVHNSGLPVAVLVSFLFVLGGLTVGWGCVKMHQYFFLREVIGRMQERMRGRAETGGAEWLREVNLKEEMENARKEITGEKTTLQRFLSLKAAHGMLMFVSWVNIAGRLFASNQSGDFTCHTYPVYKQLDSQKFSGSNATLTFVPINDPAYHTMPWASSIVLWGVYLSVGPLLFAAAGGWAWIHREYILHGVIHYYKRAAGASNGESEGGATREFNSQFSMPKIDDWNGKPIHISCKAHANKHALN
jgi:hypothetical protein